MITIPVINQGLLREQLQTICSLINYSIFFPILPFEKILSFPLKSSQINSIQPNLEIPNSQHTDICYTALNCKCFLTGFLLIFPLGPYGMPKPFPILNLSMVTSKYSPYQRLVVKHLLAQHYFGPSCLCPIDGCWVRSFVSNL